MKIYKYVPDNQGRIYLPEEHYILDVQDQHGNLVVWAIVDPNQLTVAYREVYSKMTGQDIDPEERKYYYKTLQHGVYVEHVFVK